MYLKRVGLLGFKSFANKTELVFEPGVSAIVGPNGCGKSNISDSIKWVLGEQSAKELRGSKMEDIIFNGTSETQPVNLAEVSLIFSNKDRILPVDYDEVIITRRVFRSGESEYLLNKTQVRLKDIMALLAGTGMGVSSYSIAEQGRMDRVLQARPEDRREIFEEASGITNYKTKKREALNKLQHTEENLTRLSDIVNEVKRQINSIERQANKAKRYQTEFERLKELDIKLTYYEYSQLKEQGSTAEEKNSSLKQKEGQISLELNLKQDELRIHREKIHELDERIAETRQRSSDVFYTIDKNENAVRISRERIEEINKRSGSLNREMEEIIKRTTDMKQKVAKVESELNLISGEKENKQTFLVDSEKQLHHIVDTIKGCEKAISDSKVTIMENASKQSKLKNDLNKISAGLNTAASRHRRLNIEKENTQREMDSIARKVEHTETSFDQQKKILDTTLQQLSSLSSALEQFLLNTQEKSSLIEKLKQRYASSSSKLELLKDLKEKKEGFSEGVKSYMDFIERDPTAKDSFVGIIADMIRPKEGFLSAIEYALGEKSQIIVVKTKDAAKEALRYLKNERKGRAQFIALDEVPNNGDYDPDILPKTLGKTEDFIDMDIEYKPLLAYLLQGSYLVEEIDQNPELRRPHIALVTRTGDMAKGIVTSGGTTPRGEDVSIIGRDAKIREFTGEVERLKEGIAEYEDEYMRMTERLKQIQEDVSVLENTAKKEEIKLNARESEKTKVLEEKEKLQKELDLIDLELDEIDEEESSLKERKASLDEDILRLEDEQKQLDILIAESQSTIAKKRAEKETIIVTVAERRTQMSLVNDRYNSQSAAFNMLKDSLRDGEAAIEIRREQLDEGGEKLITLRLDIERATEENRVLSSKSETVKVELNKFVEEKRTSYTVVEDIENKMRGDQKELETLRGDISSFHININELSYKLSSLIDKIQNAYKVNLREEQIVFDGDENWDSIRSETEQLQEKIDRMGPINLVAIDEHKELEERYEFLTSQQEDLLTAKESLHKAINKINRTTRKMFIETFEQIQAAFKDYFKLLFGGGAADLFLIDQSDVLESGVEIIVRPPGKKLQNISLLSGGEKALTAIALLFALFKVKPTPFCILDEIDAPLDEMNIDRFSRMLQEFVKTTQFIIITHNKKTIAISDAMYGITMEKSGISKIVSVRFAEEHSKQAKEKSQPQTVKEKPKEPTLEDRPAKRKDSSEEIAVAETPTTESNS